ncbi:MAG: hypothetical protein HKN18_14605 [Silicimonas sp.]|nr:hypothetical protein [Silicimonas sp.]
MAGVPVAPGGKGAASMPGCDAAWERATGMSDEVDTYPDKLAMAVGAAAAM